MDSRYNLKDIARKAAEAGGDVEYFQEPKQAVNNQNTAPNNPAEDFEDSPAVIIGSSPKKTNESVTNVDTTPKPVIPDMSDEDYASTTEQANLSSEDIEKLAPHLPEDKRNEISNNLLSEKSKYIKQLILDGFWN